MTDVATKIMRSVSRVKAGSQVFCAKDFLRLGYGTRQAIDTALCRLVKAGKLRRVARGLYDRPRINPALQRAASANLDAVVSAIARRDGITVMPDNMVAANTHGLTTGVPSRPRYVTSGPSRDISVGGRVVELRHRPPRITHWATSDAAGIVQSLDFLGKDVAQNPSAIAKLRARASDAAKRALARDMSMLPSWMIPAAREIATEEHKGWRRPSRVAT
jgi:hypothetical protein